MAWINEAHPDGQPGIVDPRHAWMPRAARHVTVERPASPSPKPRASTHGVDQRGTPRRASRHRGSTPRVDAARSAARDRRTPGIPAAGTKSIHAWRGSTRHTPAGRASTHGVDQRGTLRREEHPRMAWINEAHPDAHQGTVDPRHAWIPRAARHVHPKSAAPPAFMTADKNPSTHGVDQRASRRPGEIYPGSSPRSINHALASSASCSNHAWVDPSRYVYPHASMSAINCALPTPGNCAASTICR